MRMYLRLAWRNVWRNRRRTIIALSAIGLGLAMLILMDGTIAGSKQATFGNAVKLEGGNVQIHAPGFRERAQRLPLLPLNDANAAVRVALDRPEVIAVSRRIRTGGMVGSREGAFPVVIIGIEPQQEAPATLLAGKIVQGQYLTASDEDVLLIGRTLADRLEVGVGDRVTLVGRATHEQTRRRTMTVGGIYDLKLPEVEKRMVYVSLAEAQTLFDLRGQATEVVVTLRHIGQEPQVVTALRAALPGYEVDSWLELNPSMNMAFAVNEQFMAIFGLVVLLVAGIGILNVLLMAVFERTREMGVIAALGLKQRNVLALFLLEGVLIGVLGALAGCVLGGLAVSYLGQVGFDISTMAQASEMTALMGERLYPRIEADLLMGRTLTIVVIAALASLYPAWQASQREPAEALHYV